MDAKTYAIFKKVSGGGGGSGGTFDHSQLTNRDASNQHPISAITGLQDALDSIPETENAQEIAVDSEVTAGSNNLITSGAVAEAIANGGGGSNFELINHVTVGSNDVFFVDVNQDSNNNNFSLKEMIVVAKILSNSGSFSGWIRLYPNNVSAAGCDFGGGITNEDEYSYQILHAKVIGGTYIPLSCAGSVNSSNRKDALATGSGKTMTQTTAINAMQSITSVRMTSYQAAIGAGSEIWLYGVRA